MTAKGHTYEQILQLTEKDLRDLFSLGATKQGNRWRPAENRKEADRPLSKLLKDKENRTVKPRFLKPGSGYTTEHEFGLGKHRRYSGEFGEAEPEAVDEATQQRITDEARRRFSETHAESQRRAVMRSRLAQLRQLGIRQIKAGRDPAPALEAALEQLEREEAA